MLLSKLTCKCRIYLKDPQRYPKDTSKTPKDTSKTPKDTSKTSEKKQKHPQAYLKSFEGTSQLLLTSLNSFNCYFNSSSSQLSFNLIITLNFTLPHLVHAESELNPSCPSSVLAKVVPSKISEQSPSSVLAQSYQKKKFPSSFSVVLHIILIKFLS